MSRKAPVNENPTEIDITEVLRRIPHRYPFLLVDRAEDYKPSESIVGIKCVTFNEPFFAGHFPEYPVMPGVLIVEALAQTGAVLMSKSLDVDVAGKTILFISLDNCRFRQPVRPGDVLRMPVVVAFGLVAFFIWIAENVATAAGAWFYPSQLDGWELVPLTKFVAWFLLMIVSVVLVTFVYRPRPPEA